MVVLQGTVHLNESGCIDLLSDVVLELKRPYPIGLTLHWRFGQLAGKVIRLRRGVLPKFGKG